MQDKLDRIAQRANTRLDKSRNSEYFKVINAAATRKNRDAKTLESTIDKLESARDSAIKRLESARMTVKANGTIKVKNNIKHKINRDKATSYINDFDAKHQALVRDKNILKDTPREIVDKFQEALQSRAAIALATYNDNNESATRKVSAYARYRDCECKARQCDLLIAQALTTQLQVMQDNIIELRKAAAIEASNKAQEVPASNINPDMLPYQQRKAA